jgi:uncharacterized protein (TIGR03435 family)
MTRAGLFVILIGATALPILAQQRPPRFEVTSIKLWQPATTRATSVVAVASPSGSGIFNRSTTVAGLIAEAYEVHDFQLSGGENWLRTERYDVAARAGRDVSEAELREMVKVLLGDRFKLRVRTEMREVPILGLRLARSDGQVGSNLHSCSKERVPEAPFRAPTGGGGQQQSSPAFEVASVRLGGDIFSTLPQVSGSRFLWTTQVANLIGYAYDLDPSRVSSTSRVFKAVYVVEATFDPSATPDQIRQMVQTLLAERFMMRVHRVTTEVDGYVMRAGARGIKVKEASGDEAGTIISTVPSQGVVAITGRRASIAELAQELQRILHTAVWDRTGITGRYDFAFRYANVNASPDVDVPWAGTALEDSLGLMLDKQKGPLETVAVDHIEEPTPN